MATGFISYQTKNDTRYARLCVAKYKDGKKSNEETSHGKGVDGQKEIFKNRERGIFTFSVEEGYCQAPDAVAETHTSQGSGTCRILLDFGDGFFLYTCLRGTPYWDVIEQVAPLNSRETLLSLLGYYILSRGALSHAKTWWEGNYASVLSPNSRLDSPRISEFLRELGDERVHRRFFERYIRTVLLGPGIHGILIDSGDCRTAWARRSPKTVHRFFR